MGGSDQSSFISGSPLRWPRLRAPAPRPLRCEPDCGDDVLIARAAAQVACERARGSRVGRLAPREQSARGDIRNPGVQKPHWQAVRLVERLLQRVQLPSCPRQALDGAELCPVRLDGEQDARAHRLPVHLHRAGAADAVLAPDVGAGQPRLVADEVRQEEARLDSRSYTRAVDLDRHSPVGHAALLSCARSTRAPASAEGSLPRCRARRTGRWRSPRRPPPCRPRRRP